MVFRSPFYLHHMFVDIPCKYTNALFVSCYVRAVATPRRKLRWVPRGHTSTIFNKLPKTNLRAVLLPISDVLLHVTHTIKGQKPKKTLKTPQNKRTPRKKKIHTPPYIFIFCVFLFFVVFGFFEFFLVFDLFYSE